MYISIVHYVTANVEKGELQATIINLRNIDFKKVYTKYFIDYIYQLYVVQTQAILLMEVYVLAIKKTQLS